jgi:ATP-dependent DNA helicase 2 subunit 2
MWIEAEATSVRRKTKQVAKSKLDLEVTPNMRIAVNVYIKTKIVSLPSLKKRDLATNGSVRIDRTYVRTDDPDIVVDNKLPALRYGSEYVVVPEDKQDQLRMGDAHKCIRVLGFFDRSVFGLHRLISNCDCVAADPQNPNAAIALSSLIHAMLEEDKVALCRFTGRDRSEPKLVVLFPFVCQDYECFHAVQAPYSEDSREPTLLFPSLPAVTPELKAAVDRFVTARTLPNLELEKIINPTIHRFWKLTQMRSKDPSLSVPPLEPELTEMLKPELALLNDAEAVESLEALKAIRPLIHVVSDTAEEKRRRRFWREVAEGALVNSPTKNIDVKRIRVGDEDKGSDAGVSQVSTHVDSQSSIRDQILRGDVRNAVEVIESMRQEAIENEQAKGFNDMLWQLEDLAETHPRLWRELIVRGVMLISSDEVRGADVSGKDASDFFEAVMKRV